MTWTLLLSYDCEAVATTLFDTAEEAEAALEAVAERHGLKPAERVPRGRTGDSGTWSHAAAPRVPLHHLMAVVVPPVNADVLVRAALPWSGARLRRAREALKLTRGQVATELGVLPGTVAAWETDNMAPGNQRREVLEAFIARAVEAA